MKKKKKNNPNQRTDAGPPLSEAAEAELRAAEEATGLSEEDADAAELAEIEAMLAAEAAAGESVGEASIEGLDEPPLEAMDELLAELLAQEPGAEAQELAADIPEPTLEMVSDVVEQVIAEPAAEVMDEPMAEEMAELIAEPETLEAAPEEQIAGLELEAPPMEAAEFEESAALLAAVTEPEAFELQQPQEGLGALLDEMLEDSPPAPPVAVEAVVEEPATPLAAQPPLESVLSSIDRALETAPMVAGPTETTSHAHHQKQFSQLDDYVVFSLAGSDYAVPVRDVAEIGRVPGITRVPNVPDFVRGITNLRGEVVPVLNLPTLLGLQEMPATARGRVLFLQARAQISSTGLLVDEVKGIQRIQSQQLEPVTGLVDDKVTLVLRGVHGRGDRLLNVLDLEQLFELQEFRQLESV